MNRVSRIFTQNFDPDSPQITLQGDTAHYLLNVLRVKTGQPLELIDGNGLMRPAVVAERGRRDLTLDAQVVQTLDNRGPLRLTLELAMTKGERFEWALQKATELGVDAIQPLITQRSEVRLNDDRQAKKHARWQAIVIAAVEQSKRSHVPKLHSPIDITELAPLTHAGLILAPGQAGDWPGQVIQTLRVLIGPEGGFTDDEVQWALDHGYQGIGLGPRILRAETAAAAAVTLCQSRYGDFH